jgi:sugar/nucleoside kinase (ribokinase family)
MFDLPFQVAVAGHICLDIIPTFGLRTNQAETLLAPGKLVTVGPAVTATGGAVSNVGLALHRLGVPVRLIGKVGDDLFGRAVLDVLRRRDPRLAEGMIVAAGESTSYSVVINEPGRDRIFLHAPGANHTFAAADVATGALEGLGVLHFGYPPLMRRMYADGGRELADLMRRAKARGVTTTLDMAWPDPDSEAGQVNWPQLLEQVLPHVDCFLPSLDETVAMLDRPLLDAAGSAEDRAAARVAGPLLSALGERLLEMGVAVVALKLGDQGLYLRTTADAARLEAMGACQPATTAAWRGRELVAPCFQVAVAGTTGAGDCTIAGFLAGLLDGMRAEAVVTSAVAVGACGVEQVDATTGIPDWATLQVRISHGWERRPVVFPLPGWQWDDAHGLWRGPHDSSGD